MKINGCIYEYARFLFVRSDLLCLPGESLPDTVDQPERWAGLDEFSNCLSRLTR
jgi:hypothetical protein